jgi:SAM-dependent methyltransferase
MSTAYDTVNPSYDQDAVNGFTEVMLDHFVDLIDPQPGQCILDAMAGNGNLTLRLWAWCQRQGRAMPDVACVDASPVHCAAARTAFLHADLPRCVTVWTQDICHLADLVRPGSVDTVMLKSGTHEIARECQPSLYDNIRCVLVPGGRFVTLGLLFDDPSHRAYALHLRRLKNCLAGMSTAATDTTYFPLREEWEAWLREVDLPIEYQEPIAYQIRSQTLATAYLPPDARPAFLALWDALLDQAPAGLVTGRGATRTLRLPGAITIARAR